MRVRMFVAALVLMASAATAQPILLAGSIGKAPVFLDLDRTGDTVSGWYFYLKVGKQLRLEGKVDQGGLFDLQEFVADTNSRTGSFKGRIKDGRWTGTWTDVARHKSFPIVFDEVRGSLKNADGRIACTVRAEDPDFGTKTRQSIDLTLKGGRVKALTLDLSEKGGEDQSCHLGLADLRQMPAGVGITLKARGGGEHRCSVRLIPAGDYLVARIGDPSQANDDCRGAGTAMFCTPRAFWLGLAVNRTNQTCKQVK